MRAIIVRPVNVTTMADRAVSPTVAAISLQQLRVARVGGATSECVHARGLYIGCFAQPCGGRG